jgi:hypothetical protein
MREIRKSGSEGGGTEDNRRSLPLSDYSTLCSIFGIAGTSPAMTLRRLFHDINAGLNSCPASSLNPGYENFVYGKFSGVNVRSSIFHSGYRSGGSIV